MITLVVHTAPSKNASDFMPTFEAPSNYKDPKKITDYVVAKRQDFLEKAALNALTCRICAVGTLGPGGGLQIWSDTEGTTEAEASLLRNVWAELSGATPIGGHAINTWGIPMLIRRSIACNVLVPSRFAGRSGVWDTFDIMEKWAANVRGSDQYTKAADLFRLLYPGKDDGLPELYDLPEGTQFYNLMEKDYNEAMEVLTDGTMAMSMLTKRVAQCFLG